MNTKENKNKQVKLENFLIKVKLYKFRNDVVRNKIFFSENGNDFTQMDEKLIWRTVQKYHGPTSMEYLLNTICSPDIAIKFNPLKIWHKGLELDEKDHIRELTKYVGLANDTPEERERLYIALKKWFVGAVKTLFDPFYVHKQALILQGPSGIGKTPFLRSFLPPEMYDFIKYVTNLNPESKDAQISLTTTFIMILDEIDDFFKTKANRDNYKSFMTRKYVNVRLPFGRTEVNRQRICSFAGTCNESTFLNDPTGTQRFTIFNILKLHNVKYSTIGKFVEHFPMKKVWAQAYHLYMEGFNPEYTHEELVVNEEANERYKYNTPEFETIIEWFAPAKKDDQDVQFMTTTMICNHLNTLQNSLKFMPRILGKALTRLKFKRIKKKINGQSIYGYYVRNLKLKESKVITQNNVSTYISHQIKCV